MKVLVRCSMAIALVVPMAVFVAAPAGAAGGTSCKTLVGTATITPGLGVTAKNQTINATSKITACTGGGVTSGTSKAVNKTPNGNCVGLAKTGTKRSITQVITWNNQKTSTLVGSTITGPKVGQATITLKVTKGLFVGLKGSQVIAFAIAKGGGSCTDAAPLKKLTVKQVTAFVLK